MSASKIDPRHDRPMLRPSDIMTRVKSHMAQLETLRYSKQQRLADKLVGHIEEALKIGQLPHPNLSRMKEAMNEVMMNPPGSVPVDPVYPPLDESVAVVESNIESDIEV